MEYTTALESGSPPKIRKAANAIAKKKTLGYCSELITALESVIDKPKSWQTQSAIIKAIGVTDCAAALPRLKQLIDDDFKATVLYRDLAFAIATLERISANSLDFFYHSLEKGNLLQICGVCAALLQQEVVPDTEDMRKIITGVSPYTDREGGLISPRTYIAALAFWWPKEETESFLNDCLTSKSNVLAEIAKDSLAGNKTKRIIV